MPSFEDVLFEPPAPMARVTVRHNETGGVSLDVPMLLDSGADVTLIPHAVITELGIPLARDKWYELFDFDGQVSLAPAVRLELIFCRRTFRGQFLLIDQEWGILGRNVLNIVSLLLDGPNLRWQEYRKED